MMLPDRDIPIVSRRTELNGQAYPPIRGHRVPLEGWLFVIVYVASFVVGVSAFLHLLH